MPTTAQSLGALLNELRHGATPLVASLQGLSVFTASDRKGCAVLGVFDRAKEEGAIGRRDGRIQQHFAG